MKKVNKDIQLYVLRTYNVINQHDSRRLPHGGGESFPKEGVTEILFFWW